MTLWVPWMNAVRSLRPACQRSRTFLWLLLTLIGLCCRLDLARVTSYVRVLGLRPEAYHRFLHLFHSKGLDLDKLTACWMKLCLTLFKPVCAGSRLICLADGIKVPKEGKLMPAVKSLHQQSGSNSKPDYIMGHSFQAISLLVQAASGHVAAVPLMSRIHEGLVFSNRDSRTLLDKLAVLMFSIANFLGRKILLVADAYYASGKLIAQLLSKGHQLVTRAKSNAVAYLPVPTPQHRRRGRPRIYGKKVPLKELAQDDAAFTSAPSPVYGEKQRHPALPLPGSDVAPGGTYRALRHRMPSPSHPSDEDLSLGTPASRYHLPAFHRPHPCPTRDPHALCLPIQNRARVPSGGSRPRRVCIPGSKIIPHLCSGGCGLRCIDLIAETAKLADHSRRALSL